MWHNNIINLRVFISSSFVTCTATKARTFSSYVLIIFCILKYRKELISGVKYPKSKMITIPTAPLTWIRRMMWLMVAALAAGLFVEAKQQEDGMY